MRKLVIFDRDNTLIEDKGHTYKIKDLKFLPDTIKALQYISKNIKYQSLQTKVELQKEFTKLKI